MKNGNKMSYMKIFVMNITIYMLKKGCIKCKQMIDK